MTPRRCSRNAARRAAAGPESRLPQRLGRACDRTRPRRALVRQRRGRQRRQLQPRAGVTGLLGPNGAGKTTLLHMLAGFLAPSAGEVKILGRSPHRDPSVYRQIGLVPEREAVYPFLTGLEYVRSTPKLQGLPRSGRAARAAIARVGLDDAMDRPIGTYSKGMRQRVKVAGALVHDPQVLLLDEPFNGMDPRQRLAMMDLLGRWPMRAGRSSSRRTSSKKSSGSGPRSWSWSPAGLAASGDFRAIRALMTDRPHTITIRSSDDRRWPRR
jgi:ABC-2 type transport system ATP-binding protein